MSVTPNITVKSPLSWNFTVAEPVSTPAIPEPCIVTAIPEALTFPLPISTTSLFFQLKASFPISIHFLISPLTVSDWSTKFFIFTSVGSNPNLCANSFTADSTANVP